MRRDYISGFLASLLFALLAVLIFFQVKLADADWRARFSIVDAMEGERVAPIR